MRKLFYILTVCAIILSTASCGVAPKPTATPTPTATSIPTAAPTFTPVPTTASNYYSSSSGSTGSRSKCLHCGGTGYVTYYSGAYDEGTIGRCTSCNGTGRS